MSLSGVLAMELHRPSIKTWDVPMLIGGAIIFGPIWMDRKAHPEEVEPDKPLSWRAASCIMLAAVAALVVIAWSDFGAGSLPWAIPIAFLVACAPFGLVYLWSDKGPSGGRAERPEHDAEA